MVKASQLGCAGLGFKSRSDLLLTIPQHPCLPGVHCTVTQNSVPESLPVYFAASSSSLQKIHQNRTTDKNHMDEDVIEK